jgi:SpoVK/Ycf46/Vps4 family AAA+-type ATPase
MRNCKINGNGRRVYPRPKALEGVPPVILPEWFWQRNVKCVGDPDISGTLAVYSTGTAEEGSDTVEKIEFEPSAEKDSETISEEGYAKLATETDAKIEEDNPKLVAEPADHVEDLDSYGLETTDSARYSTHVSIYKEILSTLRAGLALRPPRNNGNQPLARPITVLQCPKDGGTYYLDAIVETIAGKLGADLVRLDAQDIAQIVGSYVDENLAWAQSNTALVAYEAHKVAGKLEEYEKDPFEGQEELEEDDEASDAAKAIANLNKTFMSLPKLARGKQTPMFDAKILGIQGFSLKKDDGLLPAASNQDRWNDLKLTAVFEAFIGAADVKRAASAANTEETSAHLESSDVKPRDLIIQVRDYNETMKTPEGKKLLSKLRTVIDKKWQEKRNIICVGTTSAEEPEPALAREDIQHLQSDVVDGEKRTIYVPPSRKEEQDVAFEADEKARIRRINIRHVEDMLHKLAEGTQHLALPINIEKDIDSAVAFSSGLEDAVWTFARVHRIAHTILGNVDPGAIEGHIDGNVFSEALKMLAQSDEAKFNWGAKELKQEDEDAEALRFNGIDGEKKKAKEKLRELKKRCNTYEKKLLSGVVFPSDLHTTFADIRAPKETIEALQTLTSLSLLRPEAFSYGVLATDKIPGLLLYGPPGTGKTLLAKAVAKESGATVLEITAADLNDMFVGQGEKNVRAVFTLAKKLSPCVVFLDEADAIFSARSHHNRNAHREMINQFLREWDGMTTDLSAFIMVATNRPFDLDEAVLRRLPRRLLVDLPVEKDREAILKIHLKDEVLDESVSLAKLAKETPFYSGSDLKNLSVAAAMACIRDENAAAAAYTGKEPYVYPSKRTLTSKHFDKAMEEISASISEDMSTLTAIRKFDEKYGDRKGRRKKGPGLGFGGTKTEEKDSEAAMVRKLGT